MLWLWKLSELSISNLLLKQRHQHNNSWFLCILFPGVGWGIFRPPLEKAAWSKQSFSDQADCWELHWQLLGKSEIYSSCVSFFDTWAEPNNSWWSLRLSTEYTECTQKCWSKTKLIVVFVFSTILFQYCREISRSFAFIECRLMIAGILDLLLKTSLTKKCWAGVGDVDFRVTDDQYISRSEAGICNALC